MKVFNSILIIAVVVTGTQGCWHKKKCIMDECCSALTPLLNNNGFCGQAPCGGCPGAAYGLNACGYNGYNSYSGLSPYAASGYGLGAGCGCGYGRGCGSGCACASNPVAECLCKLMKPCLWKKSHKYCC